MFKKLLSILIYYNHNMKILHWKSSTIHFEVIHELCSKYYEQLDEYIDEIAEIGLSMGENPVDLMEAYEILKADSHDYKILKADEDFDGVQVYANIEIMFIDIMDELKSLLDKKEIEKSPYKPSLEEMRKYLNIECNYKGKRALLGAISPKK